MKKPKEPKRTKLQKELMETVESLMTIRLDLQARIEELMKDEDFPNSASWIARRLVMEYEIRKRPTEGNA